MHLSKLSELPGVSELRLAISLVICRVSLDMPNVSVVSTGFFLSWVSYVLLFRSVADFQLSVASVTEASSGGCSAQDLNLQAQKLAERVC